jgi:hypothetical protein
MTTLHAATRIARRIAVRRTLRRRAFFGKKAAEHPDLTTSR